MTKNIAIGGSEIAAIRGLNQFSTPHDIWVKKTQENHVFTTNKYVEAGNILEGIILDTFSKRRQIILSNPQQKFVHETLTYCICKVDSLGTDEGVNLIVSAKNTSKEIDKEDLPIDWVEQINWEMGLSKIHVGFITWLSRGVDFDSEKVFFDEELFEDQLQSAKHFWETYILPLVPPPPINSKEILSRIITKDRSVKEGQQEHIEKVIKLRDINEQLKPLVATKELIQEEIKVYLSENTELVVGDRLLCSWRNNKDSQDYDWDEMIKTYPEIAEQFKITKPGARVLRLNNKL